MEENLLNLHIHLLVNVVLIYLLLIILLIDIKILLKSFFLNLDVKFDLPNFNEESSAKKINNWIRHIEVY